MRVFIFTLHAQNAKLILMKFDNQVLFRLLNNLYPFRGFGKYLVLYTNKFLGCTNTDNHVRKDGAVV